MGDNAKVPVPTLSRLATVYSALREAEEEGCRKLSSGQIEAMCGISAAQIRKDLSHFGEMGKPGVGYDVGALRSHIARILKLDRPQRVAIIGAGRLGQALAAYPGLAQYGFQVVGIFDSDPAKIGASLGKLVIEGVSKVGRRLQELGVRLVVLTVPGPAAQEAADDAIAGGARRILNFTPAHIKTPAKCMVRNVSFTQEFAVLAYYSED